MVGDKLREVSMEYVETKVFVCSNHIDNGSLQDADT